MKSMCLDQSEIFEITGYNLPKYQRQWFDSNRWCYVRNRAGHPVVSREYAQQKLGLKGSDDSVEVGHLPNFDAIKGKR